MKRAYNSTTVKRLNKVDRNQKVPERFPHPVYRYQNNKKELVEVKSFRWAEGIDKWEIAFVKHPAIYYDLKIVENLSEEEIDEIERCTQRESPRTIVAYLPARFSKYEDRQAWNYFLGFRIPVFPEIEEKDIRRCIEALRGDKKKKEEKEVIKTRITVKFDKKEFITFEYENK